MHICLPYFYIRQIHLKLCEILNCFNSYYGIQVALQVLLCFVLEVLCCAQLHDKVYNYIEFEKMDYLYESISTLVFAIYYISKIFYISYICTNATSEVCFLLQEYFIKNIQFIKWIGLQAHKTIGILYCIGSKTTDKIIIKDVVIW